MHKYSAPHVPDEDLLFAGQSVFKHKSAALLSLPQLRRLSPSDMPIPYCCGSVFSAGSVPGAGAFAAALRAFAARRGTPS